MVTATDALVAVLKAVLDSIEGLSKVEYNKKGRKYRFVNNNFQRIREEDKHLVICPEDPDKNFATVSLFFILCNINGGAILDQFPDFALSIIGCAQQLERNGWYEEENSSVIHYKNSKYDPTVVQDVALEYATRVEPRHISMGLTLMMCAKLNFLHTDHHIGTKVEGHHMKHYITEYYGPEALTSPDVLIALKSFVHWGNIRGVLYKLDVPNIRVDETLERNFRTFPDPAEELKLSVYDRYPSGTSKYSLIRKSIDILGDWPYSRLVPYPTTGEFDLAWLYGLCHDIEKDPVRYHLRSQAKALCEMPVNLAELLSKYSANIGALLLLVSLVINVFRETGGEFLLQNLKIPKYTPEFIERNKEFHDRLVVVRNSIDEYEAKGWSEDDIVLRLGSGEKSLFAAVMEMREKYSDDYE